MATYLFSQLQDGAILTFNPAVDVISFDEKSIAAKGITVQASADGKSYEILLSQKHIILQGSTSWQPNSENFSFLDGSLYMAATPQQTSLIGTDNADQLSGEGVDETRLVGGAGNDKYIVDSSGDIVVEEAKGGTWDTVHSSISYALTENVENLTLTGTEDLSGGGNSLSNRIDGNSGNNILSGGAGNDRLNGKAGADTLLGGTGNDTYWVDNIGDVAMEGKDAGIDTVYSFISYMLEANVENLSVYGAGDLNGYGNELDNVILGNGGRNLLVGGAGNDSLRSGSTNDGIDTLEGGTGNDSYGIDPDDLVIEYANEGIDTILVNATSTENGYISYTLPNNVENLRFHGSGTGIGNELDNQIWGTNGSQKLYGLAGNDTLDGGPADATLAGGIGNDVYIVDSAPSIDQWGRVASTGDVIIEGLNAGIDTVQSSVSHTLGANVEHLVLTAAGLSGTGNALNNRLTGSTGSEMLDGGAGHDTLDGGQDADVLVGGTGNDLYVVDDAGDLVLEGYGAGVDTVRSSVNYTLGAQLENLTLAGTAVSGTGNALANVMTGNAAGNRLSGGLGNDTLNGLGGKDTLTGGGGQDTFVLRHEGAGVADTITDFASGTDKLRIVQKLGDGDPVVEGGTVTAGPGGFAASAELVIVKGSTAGTFDATSAAAAIGSATSAYATGYQALFAVNNGSDTALYLFTSSGNDAQVSAGELGLLATLQGTASTALGDYVWA